MQLSQRKTKLSVNAGLTRTRENFTIEVDARKATA